MEKYTLGDHPEITLDFYADNAKFFGVGAVFPLPDLKEKIKAFRRENGKIIVVGDKYTMCSIKTDEARLDKIEPYFKGYIGVPIKDIENIEID